MSTTESVPRGYVIAGIIFILIGLSVFAIRLTHSGTYAMPHGAAFYSALILLTLGGLLTWTGTRGFRRWIVMIIAVIATLPCIYSIGGESQEVISLYATDAENNPVDLRLWIVDREDGAWVGMGREKAINHKLDGAKLEMLRAGKRVCVALSLNQDRSTTRVIHAMKVEKYTTARIGGALGFYPLEATPSTVVLRLDPCSA